MGYVFKIFDPAEMVVMFRKVDAFGKIDFCNVLAVFGSFEIAIQVFNVRKLVVVLCPQFPWKFTTSKGTMTFFLIQLKTKFFYFLGMRES